MKKITSLTIIFTYLFITYHAFAQQKTDNIVVVLSMDAFRWDYDDLIGTPNLDKIAEEGVRVEKWQPCFPSITFPNHYAMATGLYPNNNGLVHNTFFNKTLNKEYRVGKRETVEDGRFYKGEPIWNTVHNQGLIAYNFFWVGSEAEIDSVPRDSWKLFKPNKEYSYEQRIDSIIKWLKMPSEIRPSLIMFYFEDPDGITHYDHPSAGQKTKAIVKRCDSLVGTLFEQIKQLPNAENIHLLIVSDHGMCPINIKRTVHLRDYINENSIEYANWGSPVAIFDIKSQYLDETLHTLQNVAHISAWKSSEVPKRLHYGSNPDIGNLVVLADSAWRLSEFSFEEEKERFKKRFSLSEKEFEEFCNSDLLGAHGFDNENGDMYGIFYAWGKEFKKNYSYPVLLNIQLYNVICKILNIQPAQNDGNFEEILNIFEK
ncbi:MAG: ectonucleotide pyrophosphatase/phosphodiesterase [Bacteroidales bacterium]|jgi:alkaline phosphatase D|nr:ectonucleotide pyrophosphatase/phosphodiesterase [Bacteroidales bacterium]